MLNFFMHHISIFKIIIVNYMIIEESHFILVNIYFIEYFGGSHGANMILFKQEFEKAYFILRKN